MILTAVSIVGAKGAHWVAVDPINGAMKGVRGAGEKHEGQACAEDDSSL